MNASKHYLSPLHRPVCYGCIYVGFTVVVVAVIGIAGLLHWVLS